MKHPVLFYSIEFFAVYACCYSLAFEVTDVVYPNHVSKTGKEVAERIEQLLVQLRDRSNPDDPRTAHLS